jgi:hypothetical protein
MSTSAFGVDHGEISKASRAQVVNVGELLGKPSRAERLRLLGPQKTKNKRRTAMGLAAGAGGVGGYAAGKSKR